ncbi:hypothetical protein OKA05_00955 [Luteolibacter arcticus]|uniref:Uncharacterized protein n=1 Tax=Luteolibacter arcticus TaxID=1581411 RepID=A0ABT3GBV1_9BACT|nr:hypothetical protein [Luteolibacter arcticus]MCW1921100.1 hypothetical protein [Luteolibacter arcticus]
MPLVPALKSAVPLVVGVAVGVMGATLFRESLTGAKGSPEEQVARLEVDLKKAENRLAAFEEGRRPNGRTVKDGLRDIVDDLRAGRPVTPDDLLKLTKPLMRDLEPLLERMRVREEKNRIESMTGELARKYDLTGPQQEALKKWFEQKAEADAKAWSALMGSDSTTFEDMIRATHDVRPDEGLDGFMESQLSGEKLASFKTERMGERAERVQQEADRRVQRLDGIVKLDDQQRDQVFGIMARNSRDYDPAMQLEGIGGEIASTPGGNRQDAMLAVLRPEQREAYESERQRQRQKAEEDLGQIGLSLPPNWDLLDDEDF